MSEHSFIVQPDDFAFIPFEASGVTPGYGVYIYSLSDKELISLKQEGKNGCAVAGIFMFDQIEAVSFKDLDRNGETDILLVASYRDNRPAQGEGVGNNSKHYVGSIYLKNKGKFTLKDDCFEEKSIRELVKAFKSRHS